MCGHSPYEPSTPYHTQLLTRLGVCIHDPGNQKLDFEEFLAMQPHRVRQQFAGEDIRRWFDAADANGDGVLSINEFFCWSLTNASRKHGSAALEEVFARYDKDNTGFLDSIEFTRAASEMGFGAMAHQIFRSLDNDGSGTLSYHELVRALADEVPVDPKTKQMLSAMVWSYDESTSVEHTDSLQTSHWAIRGLDAGSVRAELQDLLRQSGGHVADLIKLFDDDAGTELTIDDMEFTKTMRTTFGYMGTKAVLDDVFNSLDTDGSGTIGFDELFEFVRGRRHSLDHRTKRIKSLRLVCPAGLTLDTIKWDVEALRLMLQHMLSYHNVGPADLINAWDSSGDSQLGQAEFHKHIMELFKDEHEDLWQSELDGIVGAAFVAVSQHGSGSHNIVSRSLRSVRKTIDIVQLQQWLDAPTHRPPGRAILRKTPRMLHRQETRRLESEQSQQRPPRVDLKVRAKEGIEAASMKAATRQASARDAVDEHMLRWEASHVWKPQTWDSPPMQRWETPKALELPPLTFNRPLFESELRFSHASLPPPPMVSSCAHPSGVKSSHSLPSMPTRLASGSLTSPVARLRPDASIEAPTRTKSLPRSLLKLPPGLHTCYLLQSGALERHADRIDAFQQRASARPQTPLWLAL